MMARTEAFAHYADPQEQETRHGGSTVVSLGEGLVYLGFTAEDGTYGHVLLTPQEATALAQHLIDAVSVELWA